MVNIGNSRCGDTKELEEEFDGIEIIKNWKLRCGNAKELEIEFKDKEIIKLRNQSEGRQKN